jgi:hypothetical protein
VGAGYNLIDPGADSVYEQVLGRVSWFTSSKLSFQLSGGVQFQEFLADAATTGIFPIFSAAIVYHPVEPTLLSFSASHSVGNSYYSDEFTETTSVGVGLNQRLLQHFYLSVQPAYNFTEYKGTFGDLPAVRTDNYFYFYVGLSTALFKKLGTSVFYQIRNDHSSDAAYNSNGSLVGFSLNYRY